jgi:hypothetical protein
MKKKIALLLAALILPPACGMVRDNRPAAYADLEKRAGFDLHCEKPSITPIKEGEGSSCTTEFHWAQTAGVRCAERQATYEYVQGRWIMNNATQTP